MSLPLIVIRPEPGCTASVTAARALGLEAHGFPLFTATAQAWQAPAPAGIDALLIGSANAPRLAGPGLRGFAGKPAYAVGDASAQAARAAGLRAIVVGSGGLQQVMGALAPRHRRLLRLCGHEPVMLVPPDDVRIIEREVYATPPHPMPGQLALLLSATALAGAVVALHSAGAARHFAAECARLAIARHRLHIAALAPRIAAAAGEGWATLATAPVAEDAALLALARQLCQ